MGIFALVVCLMGGMTHAAVADVSALRALPVLDGGRVKPIDTAARESVRLVTGREKYKGWDPLALCLAIEREPLAWESQPVIHVPYLELREMVGLTGEDQHASPAAVRGSEKLRAVVEGAIRKQRAAAATNELARLSRLEERALELSERVAVFDLIAAGRRFAIAPAGHDHGNGVEDHWLAPAELGGEEKLKPVWGAWQALLTASGRDGDVAKESRAVVAAVSQVADRYAESSRGESYVDWDRLDREVAYHQLHPFRWAWVIYLGSLLALCVSLVTTNRWVYRLGVSLLVVGILWSAIAFVWRCSITGWAPVTNIYETVIWVALVGSIVAVVLEYFAVKAGGGKIPAIAGAVAAVASGVVADIMPPEYGGSIKVLTPVLRSNLWLTVHVLTIVSSYAAFLVALVLGNIVLGQFAWSPGRRELIALNLKHLYRAVQVGVLLVAAGTILGGVWADYSWGRFWGWDPKEVWALIILLMYLALLHGRYAGWIGQWGLAAGSVACFLAVLMSWYGVNFVLGAGLHSYGFGTGGQLYVGAYALAQLAYVGITYLARRRRGAQPTGGFPIESEPAV